MHNETTLTGHVALVTGGSSGLGCATAVALTRAGASVAVLARARTDLQNVLEEIKALDLPEPAASITLFRWTSRSRPPSQAMERVRQELGPVDILINAAGTDVPGSIEDIDAADWTTS